MYLATNSEFRPAQHPMITFITEIASVYSAVRTAALKRTVYVSSLKGLQSVLLRITFKRLMQNKIGQFVWDMHPR